MSDSAVVTCVSRRKGVRVKGEEKRHQGERCALDIEYRTLCSECRTLCREDVRDERESAAVTFVRAAEVRTFQCGRLGGCL